MKKAATKISLTHESKNKKGIPAAQQKKTEIDKKVVEKNKNTTSAQSVHKDLSTQKNIVSPKISKKNSNTTNSKNTISNSQNVQATVTNAEKKTSGKAVVKSTSDKKSVSKKEAKISKLPVKVTKASAVSLSSSPAVMGKEAFNSQMSLVSKKSIEARQNSRREYDPVLIGELKAIIAPYTESPELLDNIEENTDDKFIEKLNIDSVDFVEIIVDAEERFSIKMEDEEIKQLDSFDAMYDLIETKINANKLDAIAPKKLSSNNQTPKNLPPSKKTK